MSFGKAVLTSDSTVFHEVAGPSAYYVDPNNISAIANGLQKLLEDDALRHTLESQTKEQLNKLDHSKQVDQFISLLLGTRSHIKWNKKFSISLEQ